MENSVFTLGSPSSAAIRYREGVRVSDVLPAALRRYMLEIVSDRAPRLLRRLEPVALDQFLLGVRYQPSAVDVMRLYRLRP